VGREDLVQWRRLNEEDPVERTEWGREDPVERTQRGMTQGRGLSGGGPVERAEEGVKRT